MSNHAPMTAMASELRKIVQEARPLIEEWLDTAEQLAALRDVAAAKGFDWGRIKALLKAQIQDERDGKGADKRVKSLMEKADATTAYADMLGIGAKVNENNFSAPHDPETGQIKREPARSPEELVAAVAKLAETDPRGTNPVVEVVHALAYEPEEFPNLPPECDRRVPRHAEAPIS